MDKNRTIVKDVINSLELVHSIHNIFIDDTDSPWNEKALIKRKKDNLDVKITVWDDNYLLYGRIYRLLLYVFDVVNPSFQYKPLMAPEEDKEPRMKDRHNQIWSIYVDSRLERRNIENFFNKQVRKNVFIDAEKGFSWEKSGLIFERLWKKESYTYPEITDITYNIDSFAERVYGNEGIEKEIIECIAEPYVRKHVEKLTSAALQGITNELVNFTAYNCRDAGIEPSYFGISFLYHRQVIVEIIPTKDNYIVLTLLDPKSNSYKSSVVNENTDIIAVQGMIKTLYKTLTLHEDHI